MKILYGICSWGLGHAVRSLPVIRKLVKEGHDVTVATHGRSFVLLKNELGETVKYVKLEDYPVPYAKGVLFLANFIVHIPRIIRAIVREKQWLDEFLKKHPQDMIISDNRYGLGTPEIPSYFLGHQLRFVLPRWFPLEKLTELFNYFFKGSFKKFLVPDYETNSLTGKLSHNLSVIPKKDVVYIGPLSAFHKKKSKQDLECFITISGPEPARTFLEKIILKDVPKLNGKVVINLGKPETSKEKTLGQVKIYDSLPSEKHEDFMNRARIVVSRSGYTTLMDMNELGKKALFIPTPGQTEQIYLADYHKKKGNCYSVKQKSFDLVRDLERAKKIRGFKPKGDTKKSVNKFMQAVGLSKR